MAVHAAGGERLRGALVVGYGNEFRRDDGIGPYVAGSIAARNLPGVRVLALHQLAPELAEDLAAVQVAVFVDAHIDPHGEPVRIQRIERVQAHTSMSHVYRPDMLLDLAHALFGTAPDAWCVTVAGEDFDAGEGLSLAGRRNADAAAEQIVVLLGDI